MVLKRFTKAETDRLSQPGEVHKIFQLKLQKEELHDKRAAQIISHHNFKTHLRFDFLNTLARVSDVANQGGAT